MRLHRNSPAYWLSIFGFLGWIFPSQGAENLPSPPKFRVLIQESPLAGSQFHGLKRYGAQINVGDVLVLSRELDNRHDPKAIRVEWQGVMLGYVPRRENRLLAQALDEGDVLLAQVVSVRDHHNPWLRLRFAVYAPL